MAKKLSEKQYAAIAILSLPKRGGLTYEQVAEQVGVTRDTLLNWRRKDEFNDEVKRQVMRNTLDDFADIQASIPRHIIEEGNAALYRTFMQAHGMLTEKVEVEQKGNGSIDVDSIRDRLGLNKSDA